MGHRDDEGLCWYSNAHNFWCSTQPSAQLNRWFCCRARIEHLSASNGSVVEHEMLRTVPMFFVTLIQPNSPYLRLQIVPLLLLTMAFRSCFLPTCHLGHKIAQAVSRIAAVTKYIANAAVSDASRIFLALVPSLGPVAARSRL